MRSCPRRWGYLGQKEGVLPAQTTPAPCWSSVDGLRDARDLGDFGRMEPLEQQDSGFLWQPCFHRQRWCHFGEALCSL